MDRVFLWDAGQGDRSDPRGEGEGPKGQTLKQGGMVPDPTETSPAMFETFCHKQRIGTLGLIAGHDFLFRVFTLHFSFSGPTYSTGTEVSGSFAWTMSEEP